MHVIFFLFFNCEIFKKNEYFGEISFFSGNLRTASAKAINFVTLFMIPRNEFMKIISKNPDDFVFFF